MNNLPIPTMIPYLTVRNAKDAINFYQKAFGFEWLNAHEKAEDPDHVEMRYKDVLIMFAPEGAFGGKIKAPATLSVDCSMNLYLYCDDVDALFRNALENGAVSTMEPNDSFWGDRVCQVKDPDGFLWMFAKKTLNK